MKSEDIKKFIATTIFSGGHPSYTNPKNWTRDYKYKINNYAEFLDKVGMDVEDLAHGDFMHGVPPADNTAFIVRQISMIEDDDVADVTIHVLTDSMDSSIIYCSGTSD